MHKPSIKYKNNHKILICLFIAAIAQISVWVWLRDEQAIWSNVPPAPSAAGASLMMLGDDQLAYRSIGLMLQNIGDEGGRSSSLKSYNYSNLKDWFLVGDSLDPRSNYMPLLAAYYFGATNQKEDLRKIVDYLIIAGEQPYPGKWRWLSQAMFNARYKLGDLNLAYNLSEKLAAKYVPGMPGWVLQMPSFILAQQGEKEAAYNLAIKILKDDSANMHPNEIYFMREYICTRILNPQEASRNQLCDDIK
jgi:hypothetical protein